MQNVFVVNTPFQLYVVKRIINQYYVDYNNLIVSTINGKEDEGVFSIPRGIKGLIKARTMLKDIKKKINETSFFIPHLGNLFSSYFFDLSIEYQRPIFVFYEGIALFYDPIVKNEKSANRRKFESALLGIKYNHFEQLFPDVLLKKAVGCFSPVDTPLLSKYNKTFIINLGKSKNDLNNDNVLILTSDTATEEEVDLCVFALKSFINGKGQTVYVKPHFELTEDRITLFLKKLDKADGVKVQLLDKTMPIEGLFEKIDFKYVVSQHFSSALVNMKYILGDGFKCYVVNKDSIPTDLAAALNVSIE